jgi:hypothetical protein
VNCDDHEYSEAMWPNVGYEYAGKCNDDYGARNKESL